VPSSSLPLLIPDGVFVCPRCGPTNAIAKLIWTGSLTNPLAGRCNRCEHSYQFSTGSPSTTTSGSTNTAGATTLTVALGTGFTSGSWVVIDSGSLDGGAEVVQASGAGTSTTIPLNAATPLLLSHAAGATVQTATLGPLGPMT
jgi:hypothetical protein